MKNKLILLEAVSSNYFKRKQFWDVCEYSALSNLCGERLEVVQIEDRSALNGPSVAAGTQHLAYFFIFFFHSTSSCSVYRCCLLITDTQWYSGWFPIVLVKLLLIPQAIKRGNAQPLHANIHTHTHTYTEFPLISMSGGSWSRRFLIKNIKIQRKTGMAEIDDPGGMSSSICV